MNMTTITCKIVQNCANMSIYAAHLVGHRVQKGTEVGHLVPLSRQVPIQEISYA